MVPRARQRWIGWLLPFFVLRALVPAGFMWAPLGSGVPIVLCSGISSPVLPPLAKPAYAASETGSVAGHHDHAHHHAAGQPPTSDAHAQPAASGDRSSSAQGHDHGQEHGPGHGDHESPSHESSLCSFAVAGFHFVDGLAIPAIAIAANDDRAPIPVDAPRSGREPFQTVRIRGPPASTPAWI